MEGGREVEHSCNLCSLEVGPLREEREEGVATIAVLLGSQEWKKRGYEGCDL